MTSGPSPTGTHRRVVAALLAGLTAAMLTSAPATADDAETCAKESGEVAIEACTRAIKYGRHRGKAAAKLYANRGVNYVMKGDVDRAIADFTRAIALDPKNSQIFENRGVAYSRKEQFARARADFDRAIALDPKSSSAFYNRGSFYRQKGEVGDFDRALADYDKAIELDPKNSDALISRADIYVLMSDLDPAIADLDRAIQLEPANLQAYITRGDAYRAKDDLDRAIADYGQAIGIDPRLLDAVLSRGQAYARKGEFDHAIADFDKAIELDPTSGSAVRMRGLARLYAGATPDALADLRHAAELDPRDGYTALWLDIVSRRNGLASPLPASSATLGTTKWPAPLVRMFLGRTTPQAVLSAPDDTCETYAYSGEWSLIGNARDEAKRLFELATKECRPGTLEAWTARAELKQMGEAH